MTDRKAREVLRMYRKWFRDRHIPKRIMDHDLVCPSAGAALKHCHNMLDKMEKMVGVAEDKEKFARWLGFIQGILCVCEHFTLKQLRDHNRSRSRHR
ncbi:MAG: hypothetical protein Q7R85_03310 [bacterium]|nr:hypothetical protein [bacterium]